MTDSQAFKDKASQLAAKMNKLTEAFDVSDEMVLSGDDIIDHVKEKTRDIELYSDILPAAEIVNLSNMINDFKFIRETLKETTQNGRRVLNSVSLDLLSEEVENRETLITSFAELNRAIGDNMKLYMQSYKDISGVLVNIDKVTKTAGPTNQTINNNLTISRQISTADIIEQLKNL